MGLWAAWRLAMRCEIEIGIGFRSLRQRTSGLWTAMGRNRMHESTRYAPMRRRIGLADSMWCITLVFKDGSTRERVNE